MDFYFQFTICLDASLGAGWIFHLVSAWLNTICHFCNIDNWPIFKRLTSILEELRILIFFSQIDGFLPKNLLNNRLPAHSEREEGTFLW